MERVHTIAELMRRYSLPRESVFRFWQAGLIEPARVSPLGRPLFTAAAFARIERVDELLALGMNLDEARSVMDSEELERMAVPMLAADR